MQVSTNQHRDSELQIPSREIRVVESAAQRELGVHRQRGALRRAGLTSKAPFPSKARCGPCVNVCVSVTLVPVCWGYTGLCTHHAVCAWTWVLVSKTV